MSNSLITLFLRAKVGVSQFDEIGRLGENIQEIWYLQRMLKIADLMKIDSSNFEDLAAERLQSVLEGIPFVRLGKPLAEPSSGSSAPDITLPIEVRDNPGR